MNVLGVTEKELKDLEIIQNKIGRLALGGNKLEGVEAIRGEMEAWAGARHFSRPRPGKIHA